MDNKHIMKVKFWQHISHLCAAILFSLIALGFIISSIVLSIKDFSNFWPFWIMTIISIFGPIYFLFFEKLALSRVVFSEEGIEAIQLKKQINYINWSDITSVTKTYYGGRGACWLSFVSRDKQINVDLTKKNV